MKDVAVHKSLLVLLAMLNYGFYPQTIPAILVVEGLNVAKISSLPRSRIWMVPRPQQAMMIHSKETFQGYNNHNPTLKISPISTGINIKATGRQERCRARLGSKISNEDGDVASENTTDESDLVVTTDEASTPKRDRWRDNFLSDFLYGANYVHSQYLSILWRYSILKSFTVTVPIGIALWMNQDLYNSFFGVLRSILAISSVAARLLQLPLEFAQSLLLNGWNVSPEAFAAAINFLPNAAAIPLVQLILSLRSCIMVVVETCCENSTIRFLSSMMAILVWRPSVEEWQYRSVLDKLLFGAPRWMLARGQQISPSSTAAIQRIKTNLTTAIENSKNATSVSTVEEIAGENNDNSTNTAIIEADEEDAFAPFLPDESTRILLGSILFATTRLGWLSTDPADTVALSNSPYGFTIGFLQSIGSLFSSGGVIQRDLRIFILLLAIHQTISTFFVAQHVFAGIYRRRGLVASVGAHVSWTIGKGTIVFRLLWKFWQSVFPNGKSPDPIVVGDSDADGDDHSSPSEVDKDDEVQ